ncbi:MAG: ABC transporter permease [Pseudomonadales bacterium]|nr:ABC transporter permease [Pseudomonadales bacterium]
MADSIEKGIDPFVLEEPRCFNGLDVLGIDVLQGRGFESSDTSTSQQVAIINQAFASQLWPGESPIGKSILSVTNGVERLLTVVGIIPRLVQNNSDLSPINEIVYRPITQDTPADFFLIASQQEEMNDNELQQLVIQAGNRIDGFIPINDIRSLADEIDSRSGGWAMIMAIGISVSTATLILATIGVYTVIARSITLQTQEIGIRRALGSSNSQVIFRFLRRGSYFLLPGVVVGIGAGTVYLVYDDPAGIANTVIEYLPAIGSFVGLVMAFVIVMASYLPARKAVAMEPGDALRYE